MALPNGAVGQKITATIWNALIAAVNALIAPIAFQVGRGSAQSIAGAWTLVSAAYGTPGINTGFTSFTSGVLTVATSGWYRISVYLRWPATPATGNFQVLVNSTTVDSAAVVLSDTKVATSSQIVEGSALVFLTAADALRLYVFSSTTQNVGTNPRDLNFTVEYVRA